MEAVDPNLELLVLLVLLPVRLFARAFQLALLDPLQTLPLRVADELAGSETHGLPQILQGLSDLYALLLDEVVLYILEFDEHLLGVVLPLLDLLVAVFLDALEVGQQGDFLVLLQGLLPLLYALVDFRVLALPFLLLHLIGQVLQLLGLDIVLLLDQTLLLGPEVENALGRLEAVVQIVPHAVLLLLHFPEVLGLELFDGVHGCGFVLIHVVVPGGVEVEQTGLLQGVDGVDLFLLLAQQILLVPAHLLVLHFQHLLVRLFGLEVQARVLALFAVVLEQSEKLDHVVVDGVSGYAERYLLVPAETSTSCSREIN